MQKETKPNLKYLFSIYFTFMVNIIIFKLIKYFHFDVCTMHRISSILLYKLINLLCFLYKLMLTLCQLILTRSWRPWSSLSPKLILPPDIQYLNWAICFLFIYPSNILHPEYFRANFKEQFIQDCFSVKLYHSIYIYI